MKFSIQSKLIALALATVATLAVLIGLFIYAIESISGINETRLLNKNMSVNMLMLRRHEKDFLARLNTKYEARFKKEADLLTKNTKLLAKQLSSMDLPTEETEQLQQLFAEYREGFLTLVKHHKSVGFNNASGLREELSNTSTKLQHAIQQTKQSDLTLDLMALLYAEKSFFLSKNTITASDFKNRAERLRSNIENTNLDGITQQQIAATLRQYQQAMTQTADAYATIGYSEKDGLRGKVRSTIHQTETILAKVSKHLNGALSDRIALLYTEVLVFSLIAGAFLTALVIGLIPIVIKPINALRSHLRDIAEAGGDLTVRLDDNKQDELGELASAFNLFIGKIHHTVKELADASN